jgi:hypothetical protein
MYFVQLFLEWKILKKNEKKKKKKIKKKKKKMTDFYLVFDLNGKKKRPSLDCVEINNQ